MSALRTRLRWRARGAVRRLARLRPVVRSEFDQDDLESRLVWIFGSPRTGSTWLMRLIAAGPRVVPIDETGIGMHLVPIATEQPPGPVPHYVSERARRERDTDYFFSRDYEHAWKPLMRQALLGRLHAQVAASGVDDALVLVKEPNGSGAADAIVELLPNSRMIFVLRDGRDVVDSTLDAVQNSEWIRKLGPKHALTAEQRPGFIRDFAALWVFRTEAVQRAFQALPRARRTVVRYEDLLADTFAAMRPIYDWLGLEASDDELRTTIEAHSFASIPAERKGSGKMARAATPGLWRQNMSTSEQAAMEEVMGPKLRELGYES